MHRPEIETVHEVLVAIRHAEPRPIVREIVLFLVVASADHVRHIRGQRLDLPHELVADESVLCVHVVREVADVQHRVVHVALGLLLQPGQGLRILVAHVPEYGHVGGPIAVIWRRDEPELGRPAPFRAAVVIVPRFGRQIRQSHLGNDK